MTDVRDEHAGRLQKLDALRAEGEAYVNAFERDTLANDLHEAYAEASKEQLAEQAVAAKLAGRIVLRRVMGKASFFTLRDVSGEIQCYLRRDDIGSSSYDAFRNHGDLGDIVGVAGTLMRTNKGELTLELNEFLILAKSLQPFPDKFHGIEDQELRYRRRYVDLIANENSRIIFRKRAEVIRELRRFLDERGYLEVETPMMHPIPGGAVARPFITHHNAFDTDLFLRVAPELYLKRLVVGGYERVYEINRNFRNEGISTKHNPEFTMLEFYEAYSTYEDLIEMTVEMMRELAQEICGSTIIEYDGRQVDFAAPPRRLTMQQAVAETCEVDHDELKDVDQLRELTKVHDIAADGALGWGGLLNLLFETLVEEHLVEPTFITHHPAEISPLARANEDDGDVTDRFEYYVGGREIANGFSELNDPEDQAARFRDQVRKLEAGDREAMHFDSDYITALEYGMPPSAGEGVGIDRLVMLLTNSTTIREVILFPLLRQLSS